jgi:hypothetical protein
LKPCSGPAGVDETCCRSWICQYSECPWWP